MWASMHIFTKGYKLDTDKLLIASSDFAYIHSPPRLFFAEFN